MKQATTELKFYNIKERLPENSRSVLCIIKSEIPNPELYTDIFWLVGDMFWDKELFPIDEDLIIAWAYTPSDKEIDRILSEVDK
jgi:hypothetical protein